MKKRVICAMSGGVDSSVAAALLLKQGYEVIGVFMKLWSEKVATTDLVRENVCCSVEAATAARRVAESLKIPFYVLNFEDEFKKTVVDYYIKEYEAGRTPNPCIICNRDIKGEILMKKVEELGGDYLATGHYARIIQKKEYQLHQSKDKDKDQTYFLYTLTEEKLKKILFPVGGFTKPEIRDMARKLNLPTATRRESQGICFIPDRDVCGFLHRHAKKLTKPGEIVDASGQHLGFHTGLINYTIGQREHLGLGGPEVYYVVELNSKTNTLVVGKDRDLFKTTLFVGSLSWVNAEPEFPLSCEGRIRHRQVIQKAKVVKSLKPGILKVTFSHPVRAITPGQSIVFYDNEQVLGGGIIEGGISN